MIADDHHLVRDALANELGAKHGLSVATADSYATVKAGISNLGKIDVILLDIVMPGMNGLKSVEEFIKLNTEGAVVIFSGNTAPDFISQALTLGARGFIPKTLPLRSLAAAIKLIAMGQIFVPFENDGQLEKATGRQHGRLTSRELSVLNHVSGGLTNKAIAWELGIVEETVKMHMRSICTKLDAKNRAHAVNLAAQSGLLQPYFSSN